MIAAIFEGIARSINQKPLLVAGLVAALFCVAIFGMTQITMESGWKTYLDESSEKGIVYAEYTENFQPDSTIILIIETSDPLDPAILSYLDSLETDIRQQENIKGTQSIVGVLKSANGGILPSSRAEIDRIVSALPSATQQLVNPSNSLTLVQVQLEESVSEDVQRAAMNNVISLVEQTEQPPGVTVEFSGQPAFMQQMEEGMSSNMGILIGGASSDGPRHGILFASMSAPVHAGPACRDRACYGARADGLAGVGLNMAADRGIPGPDRAWH